jgi:hypothetical protein
MTARIIDGKTISADLRGKVTDTVHRLRRDRGLTAQRPNHRVHLVPFD